MVNPVTPRQAPHPIRSAMENLQISTPPIGQQVNGQFSPRHRARSHYHPSKPRHRKVIESQSAVIQRALQPDMGAWGSSPSFDGPQWPKELLKICNLSEENKHGGDPREDHLAFAHKLYRNCCAHRFDANKSAARDMHALFKSLASTCFDKFIVHQAKSPVDAFYLMDARFNAFETQKQLLAVWQGLKFRQFCKDGKSRSDALSDLVKHAHELQSRLPPRCQSDAMLRDAIEKSTCEEPFAANLIINDNETSQATIASLNQCICRCEKQLERSSAPAVEKPAATQIPTGIARGREIFAGQFTPPNSKRNRQRGNSQGSGSQGRPSGNFKKLSRIDPRAGKPKTCRNCGSARHFARNCDQKLGIKAICHIAKLVDPASEPDVVKMMGAFQEIGDVTWNSHHEPHSGENNSISQQLFTSLADVSVRHSILHEDIDSLPVDRKVLHSADQFHGIAMGHGAQIAACGLEQYNAYCSHTGVEPDMRPNDHCLKFGDDIVKSLGADNIRSPAPTRSGCIEFPSGITPRDMPMLLGLDIMKKCRLRVDEQDDLLESKAEGLKNGQLRREWDSKEMLFSSADLVKLRRRFAHPSAKKLYNLLKKAKPQEVNPEAQKMLQDISDRCESRQRLAPKPHAFQVTLPEDMQFNHEAIVDAFFIKSKPALHIIDRGAHFEMRILSSSLSVWPISKNNLECPYHALGVNMRWISKHHCMRSRIRIHLVLFQQRLQAFRHYCEARAG